MTKPLFTKEEAERLATETASQMNKDPLVQKGLRGVIIAALATAEAEFQKRLEEAPTVYGGVESGH